MPPHISIEYRSQQSIFVLFCLLEIEFDISPIQVCNVEFLSLETNQHIDRILKTVVSAAPLPAQARTCVIIFKDNFCMLFHDTDVQGWTIIHFTIKPRNKVCITIKLFVPTATVSLHLRIKLRIE